MSEKVLMGINGIADYCGVTKTKIREWMNLNPDFPARREGKNGAWISTSRALLAWLDHYVTQPWEKIPEPERKRPGSRKGGKRRVASAKTRAATPS